MLEDPRLCGIFELELERQAQFSCLSGVMAEAEIWLMLKRI